MIFGVKHLDKLYANGNLLEQLKVHAEEYNGPCGQSMIHMQEAQIKKQALLDAIKTIVELNDKVKDLEEKIQIAYNRFGHYLPGLMM